MSSNKTSEELAGTVSSVRGCSTADESHVEPLATIAAGLSVILEESLEIAAHSADGSSNALDSY